METAQKSACKHCQGPVQGKQTYCSPKCRKAASRANCDTKPASTVTNASVTDDRLVYQVRDPNKIVSSLDHYKQNPELYATRTDPDKLNWTGWMNPCQLKANHLTANRVAIPGDWDYNGAARGFRPEQARNSGAMTDELKNPVPEYTQADPHPSGKGGGS